MSQETSEWLNTHTLIGFTDRRGRAWHYRQSSQGAEPNHYPGAIPPDDVVRRLFNWEPVEGTSETTYCKDPVRVAAIDAELEGISPNTRAPDKRAKRDQLEAERRDLMVHLVIPDRKHIINPDTGEVFAETDQGYVIHGYRPWLLEEIQRLTAKGGLGVASAGLLNRGGVAWVQAELEANVETPQGLAFRPFVTASTSLNLSRSSTYTKGATAVVCDNTLTSSEATASNVLRIRHTSGSADRRVEIAPALDIIQHVADDVAKEIKAMAEMTVSDAEWAKFLDEYVPVKAPDGGELSKRGQTIAEIKRDQLQQLYDNDVRAATWRGTGLGVLQTVNTWEHQYNTVKNVDHRFERNMGKTLAGEFDKTNAKAMDKLRLVLAA